MGWWRWLGKTVGEVLAEKAILALLGGELLGFAFLSQVLQQGWKVDPYMTFGVGLCATVVTASLIYLWRTHDDWKIRRAARREAEGNLETLAELHRSARHLIGSVPSDKDPLGPRWSGWIDGIQQMLTAAQVCSTDHDLPPDIRWRIKNPSDATLEGVSIALPSHFMFVPGSALSEDVETLRVVTAGLGEAVEAYRQLEAL